jgi:hypothetical protein
MSAGDGLEAKMRRLLRGLRDDPLVLDDDSADRLLAGRMDPADAPPGYERAAAVMAAATAAARRDELDGVESTLDAFRAALAGQPSPPRRPHMLVKFLTVKAVAAVFTGALLVGGVAAAATGSLPDAAQRIAHRVVGVAPAPAGGAHGQEIGDATRKDAGSQGQGNSSGGGQAGSHDSTTGPDLTKVDKKGLCNAYMAGKGGVNGGKYDSAAFDALERAAGGADKVADFCKDVTTAPAGGQGQGQDQQPGGAGGAGGQGQGQGQDQAPGGAGGAGDHGGGPPQR